MGGTSTDITLIEDGSPHITGEKFESGWKIAVPTVDIHTLGAGGGSIARVDEGGVLRVGPTSAGADPGPACYGRGGTLSPPLPTPRWFWDCWTQKSSSAARSDWTLTWRLRQSEGAIAEPLGY